ncbi:hypothetical protein [Segatella buccae]|uniref:hypothetical protein n=1 Tax=Segatella buccae TaxID=28126 RepID=UPI000A90348E|nr:hypothetical protein [Segatella buccae]
MLFDEWSGGSEWLLIPFRSRSATRGISQGNSAKNAVVLGEFATKVPVDGNNAKMKGFIKGWQSEVCIFLTRFNNGKRL